MRLQLMGGLDSLESSKLLDQDIKRPKDHDGQSYLSSLTPRQHEKQGNSTTWKPGNLNYGCNT